MTQLVLPPGIVLPPGATARTEPVYLTDLTRESEYQAILPVLPGGVRRIAARYLHELDEIKMDANKRVQLRLRGLHVRHDVLVLQTDIDSIEAQVKGFKSNGRKGVEGSTHRVAAGYNDRGRLDKVTFRVGRLLRGVAEPFRDVIVTAKGIGICGMPASGKTTFLRDAILIDGESNGSFGVNVVDTSNEILGEGDDPHPVFADVRQDKVGEPENLVPVLQRVIRSHGTERIYADEVGYQDGDVQLILQAERFGPTITSSVHGRDLQGVLQNRVLMPMFGLEVRPDGSSHIVGSPAFEAFIEVRQRNYFVLHRNLADSIQRIIAGQPPITEHVFTQATRLN